MKNFLKRILLAPVLALVLALAALPVAADGELASYRAASERLATLVAAAEMAKAAELLQGGEVDGLVGLLSDVRFLDAPLDLPGLMEVCERAQNAVSALALFGVKTRLGAKDTQDEAAAKVDALGVENVGRFAPELTRLHPFLVRCTAAEVAPTTRFVASLKPQELTAERRQGVEQFHAGLTQLFVSVVRNARDTRYDEGYRLAVLQALAQGAPALAGAMPVAARRQVRPEVEASLAAVPAGFAPALKTIGAALDDAGCEGFCGY